MDNNVATSLSLWELVRLNLIVCGLELTASAAIVYLPPMLLEAGFREERMSWLLGCGPFLCLFLVPIMGHLMDTCRSRYGRRIPFMTALSVLVLTSLLLVPYFDHMAPVESPDEPPSYSGYSINTYLLALSVVMIDFGTQAGLTPCEVFLQDVTKGLPIRDRAFTLYSLMCSLGSCAGYSILAVDWEKTFLGGIFGDQEYCVFYLLSFIFSILVIINLQTASTVRQRTSRMNSNRSVLELNAIESLNRNRETPQMNTSQCSPSQAIWFQGFRNLWTTPHVLRRLVYSNFFAWASLMCFLLFYADYVGEIVYKGNPSAPVGSLDRVHFAEGVRMGSFGLFLHAIMSLFTAPLIEALENSINMKYLHLASLLTFSLSVMLMLSTNNLILLNLLAMLTGVAFASMTTIPFSLVGLYHENKEVYFYDCDPNATPRGLGADMATLDTAYFCSQVLLLSFMGYVVKLAGSAAMYLITAAILAAISCYFVSTAVYNESDLPKSVKLKTNGHSALNEDHNANNAGFLKVLLTV